MSVSMFANALRTQSRLRVQTATRVPLIATRSISSLVAFRTAILKNVSLSSSVSRSFTTSQLARNELEDGASKGAPADAPSNTTFVPNNESEVGAPREAPSNSIFVASLSWKTTEEDLTEVFSKFGEVTGVRIHMYQDGRPRGSAHVDFASKDSATATLASVAESPINIIGRRVRVEFSPGDTRSKVIPPNDQLFFSGFAGDESEVRTVFKQFSDSIVSVFLLKNPRTGGRSPNGFVRFNSMETAKEAMEALNGTQTPDGEQLLLDYARPTRPKPQPK